MKFIRASNRSLVLFITDNDSVTVNTKKTKSLYISYCVPLYPLPSFPNTFFVCCLYFLYLYYPIPFLYVVFITFTFITIYLIYLYLLYSYLFYLPLLPNTFFTCTFITVKLISYNVASGAHLAGLHRILSVYKPTFVFLQEVTLNTFQLNTLLGPNYEGECNIDSLDPQKPGTAIIWLKGLVFKITNLVTCRLQILSVWNLQFVNIYGNPGTQGQKAR